MNVEDDKEIMIKYRKDAFAVSFGSEDGFGDETNYLQRMSEKVVKFPDGHVIVELDGIPIGQMELHIQEFEGTSIGYVNLYYLIPEYRNKGLGMEFIHYAEDFFKQANVSEYHLRVSPTNLPAIRLYTKAGMTKVREEHEKYPLWRMSKKVT
ncbi:GNAT family N-acetyltransferase [Neobacillus sp. MM2021_6]|nr:GNAT family N-acetyltransferase [Neobacillus sp. MM2021_6]NHC20452.1 GNAT family N-acetyltransferase [Bacillus sp. MM2020_4]